MRSMRTKSGQQGVTLLESLLGILLFSVGILAVVGLQALAVRSVAEAKYRVDASYLVNQLVSQMWVDRANLANYAYNGAGTPAATVKPWVDKVTAALPGVAANRPTVAVAADGTVTINVYWQHPEEARQAPPPPPHNFVVITQITN